jgi:hypothetical protein
MGKTVYNDGRMDILPVKEWKLILQDILDTLHQNCIPLPFRQVRQIGLRAYVIYAET